MTLAEFLLARIAEDEAVARKAVDPARPGLHWRWEVSDDETADPVAPLWLRTTEEFPTTSGVGPLPAFPLGYEFTAEPAPGMAHIARHDPARVLAECEAKRRIVEMHTAEDHGGGWGAPADWRCTECGGRTAHPNLGWVPFARKWPCPTLLLLALPYAHHPDYLPEWQPDTP